MADHWEYIPGWFDWPELYSEAVERAAPGGMLVEVGVYMGKSLIYLARQAVASGKELQIVGVDDFVSHIGTPIKEPLMPVVRRNLDECGINGSVRLFRSDSSEAAEWFPDQSCDLVFIDADHSYESVRKDIHAWRPKVKPGGILAGHDANEPGVMQALNHCGFEFYMKGRCWIAC